MIIWPAKDLNEVLDYTWTVALDDSDTIATFTPTKLSGSATIDSYTTNGADTKGILVLSGGADGDTTQISLVATTAGGDTFREVGVIPILDRAAELMTTFRLAYPAFVNVADGLVAQAIIRAGTFVDSTWLELIRDEAKVAYAAHHLVENGSFKGPVPAGGLQSFKSGDFQATMNSDVAKLTGLEATPYGRDFIRLRRMAFGGPHQAWS